MVKTEIYCDRCGKLIEESNYQSKYKIIEDGTFLGVCDNEVDLCDKCQEEVDDFIDGAISLPIDDKVDDKTHSETTQKKGYWKLVKVNDDKCDIGGIERHNFDMICSSCGAVLCGFYNFTEEECRLYIEEVLSGECEDKPKDEHYPPYCQYCGSKNEVKIDG